MAAITRAVLLAAGAGTRLRPLTNDRPKPMLTIGGRPLIEHTLLQLIACGVREFIINLHHCPDVVRKHFGNGKQYGIQIEYSYEPELLGTAGAIRRVANALAGEPFFVIYGDNLSRCNFERLQLVHAASSSIATIALFWKEDVSPHSAVELQKDDRITQFIEKPAREKAPSHWISAGINVMEPEVLGAICENHPCDFGFDVFPALLKQGHKLQGYRMGPKEGLWWIDTPEHYLQVFKLWENGIPPM
jgi:mannose-1-phosphate guanylyltransferase